MTTEKKDEISQKLLDQRMKAVIDAHLYGHGLRGRWQTMEAKTGINARRWMALHSGVNSTSLELLLALAKLEPRFSAFLLSGNGYPVQIGYLWQHQADKGEDNQDDQDDQND